jgi:xanthine dehydrogenase accessory factor
VEAILRRDDIAFCGMIGSDTKRRTFENGLAKRGLAASALARFTCPIGISSLTGKDPGTIAVAVAAQLLERWERPPA